MNWSESTVDSTVLAPDRTESAHGDALTGLDTEPATEHEQLALASPPPPKDITYRRPVVRIGLLDLLKQRLQSGHHVIENKACGARDWCRQTGQACQDQGMEFRSQFGEVWDEVNPQYWVGSACQSCGEHTRQFSSTLRERADDVCCPDWIGPAKERLASAGERLGGGLEGATEKLGRVTEQLNEVTDNLDYLQSLSDLRPLSDLHPEGALPHTELKRFLQPILKMPGQHPGPPQEDGTTLHDANATTPEVIELPPPADLSDDEKADTKNKTKAEERHSSASDDIDASAESKPSEKAPYRRSVRKTDRWKGSLR